MTRGARLAWILLLVLPGAARAQTPLPPDPITQLVRGIEAAMNAGDRAAFAGYFNLAPQMVQGYTADLFLPGAVRTVVKERERAPLEAVPPGEGFRLVVEFFVETPGRARVLTSSFDVRRPPDGDAASWRVIAAEGLTSIDGIYRLRLKSSVQYAVRDVEILADDLVLSLAEGAIFHVECDEGITGLVLLGRGEMRFTPQPASERGQLRLFAGVEELTTPFEAAFVRFNVGDFGDHVHIRGALQEAPIDARQLRRAREVFDQQSPKSFNVDLSEFSRDTWHLVPPGGDFLAEIDTRRFGVLTYSRTNAQAEDVSVYHRERRKTIALYSSPAKIAARGRFYSDDFLREYDVIDYNIEAAVHPARQTVQGRARLALRTRASMSTLMLRLNESLAVSSVTSVEYGQLLHVRLRTQHMLLVNLPRQLPPDSDVTVIVTYSGRVEPQALETESLALQQELPSFDTPAALEPHFLLSNRANWYPQNPVPDYASAAVRLMVPEGYTAVASGEPQGPNAVVSLRELTTTPDGYRSFSFRANQPLRYLAFVVSRLTEVSQRTITLGEDADPAAPRVDLRVLANPRQQGRGRGIVRPAEDILRFYTSLMGDSPFPSMTLAVVEAQQPGGHSPGFFAVVNEPLMVSAAAANWRSDPASFDGFPEFFLAHEIAHQWWGQAVGWKNYHEQWISEGFAQYFAALYAQKTRGERTFLDMLRQFRRWSLSDSDQGPVHLGYRLGHLRGEPRTFRAVVYNKGAAVLHMLRRLVGDEVFFAGLRRFYDERKFQKAGTDDLQRAFETEAGRPLGRFFERWIYNPDMPRVLYRTRTGADGVTVRFEQQGEFVFDLPVTVTLTRADGRTQEVVVAVTERIVERVIPVAGPVRQVQINRDNAALAEFQER